ncbi:hypothetical protein [Qipengyuania flava]|uniref:hypothetical protein n=1 Tax=Qipengyuania flava TaxID=192812 RepID=UPI001CFD91E5|nr:hypothetical protein [Qipengyuania flava]
MPLHFAAARSAAHSPIARALARRALSRAANDNGDAARLPTDPLDQTTRAALRHFAEHGLRAAQVARLQAERAYDEGDVPASRWWIEICRTLDGRMARQCERAFGIDDPLIH